MKKAGRRSRAHHDPSETQNHGLSHPTSLADALPASDPAYPIVSTILAVVPASRWAFAKVGPDGDLVSAIGSHGNGERLAALSDEYKRQRKKAPTGSRIAATLGALADFTSGITLLFADSRAHFGILTLLRTSELALDAASDRFSTLRLQLPPQFAARTGQGNAAAHVPDGAFYVLDSELQTVLAWNAEDQRRIALTGLHTRIAERLPTVLEETVRTLTAGWSNDVVNQPGIGQPVPFLVVRTQPLSGPAGLFIGVRIDRFREPNSLTGAAERFHISPREVQVLALLLDGNHLDQIARQLHITSSTVQDHINSMLEKTASRNRSELIARVLGWDSTPSASEA